MKIIEQMILAFAILITWSCNNPLKENNQAKQKDPQKIEIVTKTFSVKPEGEKVKKRYS